MRGRWLPALYGYRFMAKRLVEASGLVLERYCGDASNIRLGAVCIVELKERFMEFKQVGRRRLRRRPTRWWGTSVFRWLGAEVG